MYLLRKRQSAKLIISRLAVFGKIARNQGGAGWKLLDIFTLAFIVLLYHCLPATKCARAIFWASLTPISPITLPGKLHAAVVLIGTRFSFQARALVVCAGQIPVFSGY